MSDPHRPLSVFRFTLSAADALTYQRLPRELAGREKVGLFAVPFLSGGAAAAAPEDWQAWTRWAVAVLVGFLLAILLLITRRGLRRGRARRAASRQGDTRVEDWGDHLAVHSRTGSRVLALETIAQVIADREHVFLRHDGGPTILPVRAFADAGDMQAYAAALERRSIEAGA